MSETHSIGVPYGLQITLGFRKTVYEDGYSRFVLDLDDRHANRGGIPHGGVYAAMLDSALGAAASWADNARSYLPSVTLNLNISFVGKPDGQRLICDARRVGGGKSNVFCEGTIADEHGTIVARASGTFRVFPDRA